MRFQEQKNVLRRISCSLIESFYRLLQNEKQYVSAHDQLLRECPLFNTNCKAPHRTIWLHLLRIGSPAKCERFTFDWVTELFSDPRAPSQNSHRRHLRAGDVLAVLGNRHSSLIDFPSLDSRFRNSLKVTGFNPPPLNFAISPAGKLVWTSSGGGLLEIQGRWKFYLYTGIKT